MAKAVKAPKKRVNGYQMPDPLPQGLVLQDLNKKKWKLGPSIGKGGFGEIYSAQEADKSGTSYPYVIKIEPHENGPLFVEMHFYIKNAKIEMIDEFKSKKKLKTLGMPVFKGSGSHEYNSVKYRFLVMDKFGNDVDKLLVNNGGSFAVPTVLKLASQLTYVLEYIHSVGYVHADLKGANILMGLAPGTTNQAYLVDFGLATKFTTSKDFKPNPKKAHDGTIEYLSRDAHEGVATRRGDFEVLVFNLVHWLGGSLPWKKCLRDPVAVHTAKKLALNNVEDFLKKAFGKSGFPDVLLRVLNYVGSLDFNQEPNYTTIQKFFNDSIKACGDTLTSPLKFSQGTVKRKSGAGLKSVETPEKKPRMSRRSAQENGTPRSEKKADKVVRRRVKKKDADIDDGVEKISKAKGRKKAVEVENPDFDGFTPAMRAIVEKRAKTVKKPRK